MTVAPAEVQLIGGVTQIVGILRRSRGQYWIRQGFGKMLIFAEFDLESMVGKRIAMIGKRARTRGHGRSKDTLWVTVKPTFAQAAILAVENPMAW